MHLPSMSFPAFFLHMSIKYNPPFASKTISLPFERKSASLNEVSM